MWGVQVFDAGCCWARVEYSKTFFNGRQRLEYSCRLFSQQKMFRIVTALWWIQLQALTDTLELVMAEPQWRLRKSMIVTGTALLSEVPVSCGSIQCSIDDACRATQIYTNVCNALCWIVWQIQVDRTCDCNWSLFLLSSIFGSDRCC